ncbi:imidazoleglycerol-phosphate dehydratase HisB [Thermococcus barophilus]|uniref:Imidazoleglycerol-phosphate dehydratase n=1 Tax=Thermococcus barophilus TaxID=55802 RepID=A0A0S1X9P9_THEBA|nr:imidazoleglycerol-phosphate dehydratase HisB [Thermococcus barophilus]ALM74464.1 Imidazoleglycerol-phosphate dehydratase [Thermococcus barophilus]
MRRKTKETDITVEIGVDGGIETGDRVFDHLLTALFFYMQQNVSIKASYDLRHHLWEDLGIVLGEELREKIKGRKIARFGSAIMPMDDALVLVAVDISRPYLNLELDIKESEKGFEVTLVREFLWALARTLNATIHVKQLAGVNAHHIIEAAFKGLGVALRQALSESKRLESTKGVL